MQSILRKLYHGDIRPDVKAHAKMLLSTEIPTTYSKRKTDHSRYEKVGFSLHDKHTVACFWIVRWQNFGWFFKWPTQ